MKVRHSGNQRPSLSMTLIGAILVVASANAAAVDGGQIRFAGAIVAPPFSVMSSVDEGIPTSGTVDVSSTGRDSVTVSFSARPNSAPSAAVALTVRQPTQEDHRYSVHDLIAVTFADGDGRRLAPDASGDYHLDASGGRLSLTPRSSPSETLVIVSTRYE